MVGDQTTCLEISDKNGARVTGDLEVTGDIRGNITDIVFDDITTGDIVCDSITIDDIAIDGREIVVSSGALVLDADSGTHIYSSLVIKDSSGDETVATLGSTGLSVVPNPSVESSNFSIDTTAGSGSVHFQTLDSVADDAYMLFDIDGYLKFQCQGYGHATAESDSEPITLLPGTSVVVQKDLSETTAATVTALSVDLGKTGASTSDNTIYGLNIDADNTTATNGTNTMYGIYCSPTLTHAADAGTSTVYGAKIVATGGTNGTSTAVGLELTASSADTNIPLKLVYDGSNYTDITVASDGHLEIATTGTDADLTLDSGGDIALDPGGHDIFLKYAGTDGGKIYTSATLTKLQGVSTNHGIELSSNGTGNVVLDSDGDIDISSNDGNFIMRKGATEFSAANSAYAGMILGYTRIQNDGTGSANNAIVVDTSSMTVLQTDQGTDFSIQFIVPPSGNVEIQCSFWMQGNTDGAKFSLSTGTSYAELGITHTYDADYTVFLDETDHNFNTVSFSVTGLTAGTDTTYYVAALASGAGVVINHGRFRITGNHYPPIILKAIALPATIVTGE